MIRFFNWITGRGKLLERIADLEINDRHKDVEQAFQRRWLYDEIRRLRAGPEWTEYMRLQSFEKDHFHDIEDLRNRLKTYSAVDQRLRERLKMASTGKQIGLK